MALFTSCVKLPTRGLDRKRGCYYWTSAICGLISVEIDTGNDEDLSQFLLKEKVCRLLRSLALVGAGGGWTMVSSIFSETNSQVLDEKAH